MNGLKYLIIVITALLISFFGIGYLLPKHSYIERHILIDSPADSIYPWLANHEKSLAWSPWAEKDPAMLVKYENGASGLNATMHWKSNNPDVGSGSSTFIELVENEHVKLSFDFGDMMISESHYALQPTDQEKTEVRWGLAITHDTVLSRFFGLIIDDLVGRDFERGLANLKRVSESTDAEPPVNIITKDMPYNVNGVLHNGFLAYPANKKNNPGIIVVHESWGHNDYARSRATQLAELGYASFALDMYGGGKQAEHPEHAKEFMAQLVHQEGLAAQRFDAALTAFKNHPATDETRIAAIGYSFGGNIVLRMARIGKDLKGVVSFHGVLAGLPPVTAEHQPPVLVFNGAHDQFITKEDISLFVSSMNRANAKYEFISLDDAKHSFTNPAADALGKRFALPLEYNQHADQKSWLRMQQFFQDIFAY